MDEAKAPKAFLSHSWADKDRVRPLAEQLLANGIDVWFDQWEMGPGDSLVQKINEGLQGCDAFLVAISEHSVQSKWVREELSSAVVRRIEDSTRLIPITVDSTPVPAVINHLIRVPLDPLEEAVQKISKSIFGVGDKPPIGKRPVYIERGLVRQGGAISGLGAEASAVLREMVKQARREQHPFWGYVRLHDVQEAVGLDETEFEDALDLLSERGLIEILDEMPRSFVRPKARAWTFVADDLDFDLTGAMQRVAACAVAHETADVATLEHETGLPFEPLMTAVYVLGALHRIDVFHGGMGAGGKYGFVSVSATRKTREWVKMQARKS